MNKTLLGTLALAGLICAPLALVYWLPGEKLFIPWVATLAIFVAFTFACGKSVSERWLGALIDERNVMSLARFQIVLWTMVILSGYIVAALYNVVNNVEDPLRIAMQQETWWLMGISTTSLVGSPLILAGKTTNAPNPSEVNRTFQLLEKQGDQPNSLGVKGQLIVNRDIAAARWTDLFTGEEVGNAARLDIARLQMFFFTLITVLAYAAMLGRRFSGDLSGGIHELPSLDTSMLALIAISHGGYLTSKAVPHSQSGSGQPVDTASAETDNNPAMG